MRKLTSLDPRPGAHPLEDAPDAPRGLTPGQVFAVMLLGLLLGALLNADSLLGAAEQRSFDDPNRDRLVPVWLVVQHISHALFLDMPGNLIEHLGGIESGRPVDTSGEENKITPADAADRTGTEDAVSPESAPVAQPIAATAHVATPDPSSETDLAVGPSANAAAVDATPEIRVPTTNDPLRVWIGGDSMSGTLGNAFRRVAMGVRVILVTPPDVHVSTGLSRPDFFDWPAYLEQSVLSQDYEIVILMVGANDSQSLRQRNGSYCRPFGQCWLDTYRSRVASTMDLLRAPDGNRLAVWIGQPIMGPSSSAYGIEEMNHLYWDEARKRNWVVYFDSWNYFVDASGAYAHYLPAADGTVAEMRAQDEIHLTVAGGYRLAWAVMERLGRIVDLSNGTFDPPARVAAPTWISERAEVPAAVVERID